MFCTTAKLVTARKEHQCVWCCEMILKGEKYHKWNSVDDSWSTNKMHDECYDACLEEGREYGDYEFMPYSNVRPEKE